MNRITHKENHVTKFFFLGTAFFCGVVLWHSAHAAERAVAVSPTVVEVAMPQQSQKTGVLLIKNTTAAAQEIQLRAGTFDVDALGRTTLTIAPIDGVVVRFTQTRVALEPGETYRAVYTIESAADAFPGVHRMAAVIETLCPTDATATTRICVRTRIGVPVIVTVDDGTLRQSATATIARLPLAIMAPRTEVGITVRNDGDRVIRPRGSVIMRSLFGRDVVRVDFLPQRMVLPAHERRFTPELVHPRAFGLYNIAVKVLDGDVVVQGSRQWVIIIAQPKILGWMVGALIFLSLGYMWHRRNRA